MAEQKQLGGTRWLRALALIIGALVPAAIIGGASAQSVLAAGFAAQSERATLVTDGIVTSDPVGIVIHPQLAKDANGNTYKQYVVKLQASNATLRGLCVTEKTTMFGQTLTLIISSDDQEVHVSGLWATLHTLNTSLAAYGSMQLNQNAADVVADGASLEGIFGELGISSQGSVLGPSRGTLQAAYFRGAKASNLHARLVVGDVGCD